MKNDPNLETYRRLLRFTGDGVYRYTVDGGRLLWANRGFVRILDLEGKPEDYFGRRLRDLMVYTEPEGSVRKALRKHGEIHNFLYGFRTLKRTEKWVIHDSFVVNEPGTGRRVIEAIVKDVTGLRRAEEAAAAGRERLEVTLRSIGDGVIATDRDGRVELMNAVAEGLTGWSQSSARGRRLSEVFRIVNEQTRRPCQDPAAKVLRSGQIVGLANHTVLISRDGREQAIADSGAPIRGKDGGILGVVVVFRDVTEQRRSADEALKREKLESLGLLAGGIAHDFNNLLTAVLGNVSAARAGIGAKDPKTRTLLLDVEEAALRAKSLTQQLLTFAKGGAPVKETADLNEVIRSSAQFASRGSRCKCVFELDPDLPKVDIDVGQMSQVIENLVINAAESMPVGGFIHLQSARARFPAAGQREPRPGPCVEVRVSDKGVGIPGTNLKRIFDPYFSTKKTGSGLGLTTTYSIVKRHGGSIAVESARGEGTTFIVRLPVSGGKAAGRAAERPAWRLGHPARTPMASGKILVMDDEPTVRTALARLLRALGCTVQAVPDGQSALKAHARAADAGRPFDLVFLDLTVSGGMGGCETLRLLRGKQPGVKAIASSGYSNDPVMQDPGAFGFVGRLTKPYRLEDLQLMLKRGIPAARRTAGAAPRPPAIRDAAPRRGQALRGKALRPGR